MKKIVYLFVLVAVFLLPVFTFAEAKPDKEFSANEKEVKVYFFYGDGCPHCAEAEEWFAKIEKEYGSKFEVVAYETWKNADNDKLMKEVGEYKEQEVEGVPYILIGNSAWNGFDQSYTEAMLSEIDKLYKQDPKDRYDIMDYVTGVKVEDNSAASIIALVAIIIVVAGIGTGIYFSRKHVQ